MDDMAMLYVALGLAWWLIGIVGFVYWWTEDFDFTIADLPLGFFVGFIGPLAFICGFFIHGTRYAGLSLDGEKK